MARYEYKVVPAPAKGLKAPRVKGPEARFAHGLETAINGVAAEGWEYLRADILPSEERQGLTSTHTVYRSVLVFRRELAETEAHSVPLQMSEDEDMTGAEAGPEATSAMESVDNSSAYRDAHASAGHTDAFEDYPGDPDRSRT